MALAGLNHKMGQSGITNTVLNFGDGTFSPGGQPGAVGYLVGDPHRGIAYMFTMMNEARLGVGMGAVALGYTPEECVKGLETAKPYARRLNVVDGLHGTTVIDDCYNANPASMGAALDTLRSLVQPGGRAVAVLTTRTARHRSGQRDRARTSASSPSRPRWRSA